MRLSVGHAGSIACVAFAAGLVAGCGSDKLGASLGPPETFRWVDQPITFAPPPAEWLRDRYGNDGRRGIGFVNERSGDRAIIIAEVDVLGGRDRSAALRGLLARFDAYRERDLDRALTGARWPTDRPFVGNEAEVATAVNYAVDRAMTGRMHQDRSEVRMALMEANAAAARLQLSLDDVLTSPEFEQKRHARPDRYRVNARTRIMVGGEPAERVDYTWRVDGKSLALREVHVVRGNRMFVASVRGADKKDFRLFDQVVQSIAFPPREALPAR